MPGERLGELLLELWTQEMSARGVETLQRDEFSRKWTGFLLLLAPEAAKHVEPSSLAVENEAGRL